MWELHEGQRRHSRTASVRARHCGASVAATSHHGNVGESGRVFPLQESSAVVLLPTIFRVERLFFLWFQLFGVTFSSELAICDSHLSESELKGLDLSRLESLDCSGCRRLRFFPESLNICNVGFFSLARLTFLHLLAAETAECVQLRETSSRRV